MLVERALSVSLLVHECIELVKPVLHNLYCWVSENIAENRKCSQCWEGDGKICCHLLVPMAYYAFSWLSYTVCSSTSCILLHCVPVFPPLLLFSLCWVSDCKLLKQKLCSLILSKVLMLLTTSIPSCPAHFPLHCLLCLWSCLLPIVPPYCWDTAQDIPPK